MSLFSEKVYNFLEYFGYRSPSYHHSEATANYVADDISAYYLDFSARAEYRGPFDLDGIPLYRHKGKDYKLPVFSTLYALGNCELYRKNKDQSAKKQVLRIADWLAVTQKEGGEWLNPFPMKKFGLEGPSVSAITQGKVISLLIRAFLIENNSSYVEAAIMGLGPYNKDATKGGVRRQLNGHFFYEEYPGPKKYHVLNGFIFALWGLLDIVRLNNNDQARQLWNEGLKTLNDWLPEYDTGYWSLYHIGEGIKNPATIPYHRLHIEQLKVMYNITGNSRFNEYAELWQKYLNKRFNALKTLPSKIFWNLARGF